MKSSSFAAKMPYLIYWVMAAGWIAMLIGALLEDLKVIKITAIAGVALILGLAFFALLPSKEDRE